MEIWLYLQEIGSTELISSLAMLGPYGRGLWKNAITGNCSFVCRPLHWKRIKTGKPQEETAVQEEKVRALLYTTAKGLICWKPHLQEISLIKKWNNVMSKHPFCTPSVKRLLATWIHFQFPLSQVRFSISKAMFSVSKPCRISFFKKILLNSEI